MKDEIRLCIGTLETFLVNLLKKLFASEGRRWKADVVVPDLIEMMKFMSKNGYSLREETVLEISRVVKAAVFTTSGPLLQGLLECWPELQQDESVIDAIEGCLSYRSIPDIPIAVVPYATEDQLIRRIEEEGHLKVFRAIMQELGRRGSVRALEEINELLFSAALHADRGRPDGGFVKVIIDPGLRLLSHRAASAEGALQTLLALNLDEVGDWPDEIHTAAAQALYDICIDDRRSEIV